MHISHFDDIPIGPFYWEGFLTWVLGVYLIIKNTAWVLLAS